MDYDNTAIAATYAAARGYRADVLQQWLDVIAGNIPHRPTSIVDLGCGTGGATGSLCSARLAPVV